MITSTARTTSAGLPDDLQSLYEGIVAATLDGCRWNPQVEREEAFAAVMDALEGTEADRAAA